MDPTKIIEVMRIAVPVFALIGIGKALRMKGHMTREHQIFLNNLTYYLALPSLIFAELSVQPIAVLFNPAVIAGTLAAVGVMAIIYTGVSFVVGIRKGLAAAVVFGTFWANVSYMGFPLVSAAFGESRGLGIAAIVNAFAMPAFMITGFLLIAIHTNSGRGELFRSVVAAIINPVIVSAILGLLTACVFSALHLHDHTRTVPFWLVQMGQGIRALLKLIGSMGLPLALLSVGASLSVTAIGRYMPQLLLTVSGKLVVMPLVTFFLIRKLFPGAAADATGVAVLLMATPLAVTSYVVSVRMQVEETFVSSMLAFSTMASIVTIPVWLYFLL